MAKQLPKRDLENVGLSVTGACVALVTLVVAALIFMVAQKGLSAFIKEGVSVVEFFTGTKWDLANTAENGLPYTGALPLIVTSFAVMVLSTLIALPIAIGIGALHTTLVFDRKREKLLEQARDQREKAQQMRLERIRRQRMAEAESARRSQRAENEREVQRQLKERSKS